MMLRYLYVFIGFFLLSAGCATQPPSDHISLINDLTRELDRTQHELRKAQMEKKLLSQKISEQVVENSALASLPSTLTEDSLYAEIIKFYRARDLRSVQFLTRLLVETFPESIHCDSALYLSGRLFMNLGRHTEAVREFQRIITDYPYGSKKVSALFAKGQAFVKLNLKDYARESFAQVSEHYPGSPESARVEMELRLLSRMESLQPRVSVN